MAYDEVLAERLNTLIKRRKGFTQKKMFGGDAFLLNGNMCFGVHKEMLVLRLDEDSAEKALKRKYTKPFDITGRPMKGWIIVEKEGVKGSNNLKNWTEKAVMFVKTLPKK